MQPDRHQRDYAAVRDMLQAMRDARTHVAAVGDDRSVVGSVARDAALYRVLVLGEAATRVSEAVQEQHTDVPWSDIIGMRNVLIHGYEKVNWAVVLQTIETDFPALEPLLERILRTLR